MELIKLKTFSEDRGDLTVIEQVPFPVKRIFWISNVDASLRGAHRHKTNRQACVCIKGYCEVVFKDGKTVLLNSPDKCLIIEPEEWHIIHHFSDNGVLLVLCSERYNTEDYIWKI